MNPGHQQQPHFTIRSCSFWDATRVGFSALIGAHYGMVYGPWFVNTLGHESYLGIFGTSSLTYILNRALVNVKQDQWLEEDTKGNQKQQQQQQGCLAYCSSSILSFAHSTCIQLVRPRNAMLASACFGYAMGFYGPRSMLIIMNPLGDLYWKILHWIKIHLSQIEYRKYMHAFHQSFWTLVRGSYGVAD